jgi:RimJ/RimL family protein N-acetyltransferase
MKIEVNGLVIERLKERDIELVRQWRNSDNIRKNMIYREIITPEQQLKWFRSINNFNNFYFIVEYKGRKVGLVDIKDINWEERSGEAGVFMMERDLSAALIPMAGALSMSELVVDVFGFKKLYAKVLKNNKTMQKLNGLFGYKKVEEEGNDDKEYDKFYITPESYNKYSRKWLKLIHAMGFDSGMMKFIMEPEDYENDFGHKMEKLLEQSKIKFDIETVNGYKVYTRLKR